MGGLNEKDRVNEPLILGSILLGSAVLAWLISLGNHFDSCSKVCVRVIRLLVV